MCPNTWLLFLSELVKKTEMNTEKPMLQRHSSAIFGDIWLAKVWRYLTNLKLISIDPVQELCLVKTKESDQLKKVSDSFICGIGIDDFHIKTLAYFKIWVVDTAFHDNPLLKPGRGIVQEYTNEGKSQVLARCITNDLDLFNDRSTDTEKEWFKEFLPGSIPKSLISYLRRLDIFKCFSSVHTVCFGYTSLDQCDRVYVGNKDFPIQFPKKIIMSTNKLEERLLQELNASKFDLNDCVQNWLEENGELLLNVTDGDKRKFCYYVLRKKSEIRNWEKIQPIINQLKFIKSETKQFCSAKELYDPNDCVLKELFLGESRFPEERRKKMSLLSNLTFRRCQSPEFMLDIVNTCQNFEMISTVSKERKSNALLQVLRQNPQIVESLCKKINRLKVVPFQDKRNTNYPKSMEWYTNSENFVSFEIIYSSQYLFIIGSVLPTAEKKWEEFIDTSKQPALSDVISHFRKVVMCYNEEEHTGYSFMMEKIYQYLAGRKQSDFVNLPTNCVFTEKGFLPVRKIYIEHKKSDVDLKPYFIPLPKEYIGLRTLFEKFGCKKSQSSDLLVQCLIKIEKSHQEKNTESDSNEDLIKVEQILKKLSELTKEELAGIQNKIKVPIQTMDSDKLEFRFAQECAYSDSDWLSKTFTDEDSVCLIHSKIDKGIANTLGVKSLKKCTISDAEEICSEFGQSEPLTKRLNRLLEEGYTDGLSVPKELIQNADDAGASEIYFLYDERENEDARSCLLDSGMLECQGPALWAFNNALFKPGDFENIQKLSGATKKHDTTKIGKFGLGFNAVYNLTDVPSFVSGTHLVYLDPHGKYLGDAIVNKRSPGIKLNLKNGVMLRKFVDQFKPYQDVFGFRSSVFAEGQMYEGTLFRFPLRTKSQSRTSEISNKEYSPKEMEKLMKQFCKTGGNMILFTQNIKQIKIFHVNRDCKNPDEEKKLVLTITKEEKCRQTLEKFENNILKVASEHCISEMHSSNFIATFQTKIILSSKGHSWIDHTSFFHEETNWLVSWALGHSKSLRLFHENKSDYALPLSSVGIPVDISDGHLSPVFLGTRKPVLNKFGFYETGHLFCFLPLPIRSPFAFHVNGTFAVSSDRQRLLTRTEDDKDNTRQSVWNNSLLSDATLDAILELLIVVNNCAADNYSGYELWPTTDEDILWRALQDEFFKAVVERLLPVFKTHQGYKTFQECIFLHLEIKSDEHLKGIAFNIFKDYPLDGKIITDIPDKIYLKLEATHGNTFVKHVVSYEKFITESFLPNIAKFSGNDYDKIVLGALRSKDESILMALRDCNCITTCTEGLRKSPPDLVDPRSLVSGLFSKEDGRFPSELFCNKKDLEVLVNLGMIKDKIQFDLLKMQTMTVSNLSTKCSECAFLRSKNIVNYIRQNVPKEFWIQLSDIPFLPVKQKPDNWPPIKWAIDASMQKNMKCFDHKDVISSVQLFETPCNLYLPRLLNLVGCSKPLLGKFCDFSIVINDLQPLGLKTEKDIDMKTLQCQLMEMTKIPENAQVKKIEEMCRDLYRTMSERLTEPDIEDFVCNELPQLPCIITEKKFVYPKQVVFSLMHDCSPFFYGLRPWCVGYFTPLMEKCGVRSFFEPCEIIDALSRIKIQNNGQMLSKETLGLVSRITNLFGDFQSIPVENLFLPDANGFFCPVSDLCINDLDWISTTESMKVLNATISLKVAKMAGIKSKRVQSILDDSEEFGEDFGQHEDLASRIKRILDGYPQGNILKELVQNADDAGATEMHFIKDFRSHGTEHIFSDNWKELQGPALCVYNDSVFTEKDMKGIQKLGIGSKGEDPTSTGQYGVGFNVVYHLTDAPSFLTRDLKNKLDTYCVLDPQHKYISDPSLNKTGRKFPNASEMVKKKFTDIMPCFLEESEIWNSSRGTLFRFPLRCNTDSLLSHHITSCVDLNAILDMLKIEIAECLIFLHNVRKIRISSVNEDGSLENEFTVTAEISNKSEEEDLQMLARNVQENLTQNSSYACEVKRKEIRYLLNIRINNEFAQEWLVVTAFGFMNKSLIPSQIQNAYAESRLVLLPTSGIAFNLKNERLTQNEGDQNVNKELKDFRAYCFLPLPLHTGLPVHVNGHFALDHEARQNIWWPEEEDLKASWNRCLIENVIVPTYVSFLHHLKSILFIPGCLTQPQSHLNVFYNAFPCMGNIRTKVWQHAAESFYNCIIDSNCCVFPIVKKEYENLEMTQVKQDKKDSEKTQKAKAMKLTSEAEQLDIKWVPMHSGNFPAYFDDIKSEFENNSERGSMEWTSRKSEFLSNVLKDLGMKIIDSPMQIFHSMKAAQINVQTVSPRNVLHFLKSYISKKGDKCNIGQVNVDVSQTRFKRINAVCHILDYCLKDKDVSAPEFQNVPLLLSEAKTIHEFEEKNQIFLTPIKHLLPLSANKIVHSRQYDMLYKSDLFQKFVKNLRIQDFASLIVDNVPEQFCRGTVESWGKKSEHLPNNEWIVRFWLFLCTNLKILKKEFYDQNAVENKTIKKEQNHEKSPIENLCSSLLKNLGLCSFLPVSVNGADKLYPLGKGKQVLKLLPKSDRPEQLALIQMNVPVLDEQCLSNVKKGQSLGQYHISEITEYLVATLESAIDTLNCIYENRKTLNLNKSACAKMLEYFVRHIDIFEKNPSCKEKLRDLPLYCSLDNKLMALSRNEIIVLPEEMPESGLQIFGVRITKVFIRQNRVPSEFFAYMGCITMTAMELYIHYILPHFNQVPSIAVLQHVVFIKNNIFPQLLYNRNKKTDLFRVLLQTIAFIPVGNGRLARACEFYNPHKEIFMTDNQLCSPSELPPSPFNEREWEHFLLCCGMKNCMTTDMFLDFANRLESLANEVGITCVVKENSKRMVQILFSDQMVSQNFSFQEIQDAKFLIPLEMHNDLLTIVPQRERKSRLICFHDTTLPSNELLVWTVMDAISTDISNMMSSIDLQVAVEKCGFKKEPCQETVLNHTVNVCNALNKNIQKLCSENIQIEEFVTSMMTQIYTFLQNKLIDKNVCCLKNIPFIFIIERKIFVAPEQVVLSINEPEEIPPYLFKTSSEFGQFHSLFEKNGAAKSLTYTLIANVLVEIWNKSKGKILQPNERSCAYKAVKILFSKLKTDDVIDFNVSVLYLPGKNNALIQSSALIFIDNRLLEDRIGNNMPDMDYFVGFKELGMKVYDPVSEICRLPEKHRPYLLSRVVIEQLDAECKQNIIPSAYAQHLQALIHSENFLGGVCRLIRDEQYKNDCFCDEAVEIEIGKKLQLVEVKCVDKLTTVMTYKNEILSNTSRQRVMFSVIESNDTKVANLCIYFEATGNPDDSTWLKNFTKQVAITLNGYLGKPFRENIIHLPDLLKCILSPMSIERELDNLGICKIDERNLSKEPFIPVIGT